MTPVVRSAIWVVSLDTANERRRQFAEAAAASSVPWHFFDAHRGLASGLDYAPAVARQHKGRDLRPGELGCYSSHFSLWRQLIDDDNFDQYIVLEDDVIVDWDMMTQIAAHDFSKDNVHYVRLYYKFPHRFRVKAGKYLARSVSLIQLFGPAFGTQGYVIDKVAAASFIDACRIVKRPIDDAMDRYWEHGVPNLSLFPFPILERLVPSTIGMERFNQVPDRLTRKQRNAGRRDDRAQRAAYFRASARDRLARLRRDLARFMRI